MKKSIKWSIIGGGNGGQAAGGHLGIMGFDVNLYDISSETVEAINLQGGIEVCGAVTGFGKIQKASLSLEEVICDTDIIMIVVPALAHKTIAQQLSPLLKDGQIVFLHPGATLGALEFRHILDMSGCKAEVIICESLSLLYACRLVRAGSVDIKGIKRELMVSSLPANKINIVMESLNTAFPTMYPGKNVLETSLSNLNALMHPAPSLLNTSLIESVHDWKYYLDGITPSIGSFVVRMDKERLLLGELFGLKLDSVMDMYIKLYGVSGDTLTEMVRQNDAYKEISGQKRIDTRYILEDIPMGLVPMVSLAKKFGVSCEMMDTVCKMSSFVLDSDLITSGRTAENLGIDSLTLEEFLKYIETGIKYN